MMEKHNIEEAKNKFRRQMCSNGLHAFAKIYLKDYLKYQPSSAHQDLYRLADDLFQNRQRKVVVAAPRGFGKTTMFGTILILYALCYAKEKLIVVCSNTANQAQDKIEDIRKALLENELIRLDFPELFNEGKKLSTSSKKEIITANGIKVEAFGYLQKMRGKKYGASRPTLVLIDDLDSENTARNLELKNKLSEWFSGALLKIGDEQTNFIMIGNVFNRFSIIGDLCSDTSNHDWDKRVYKAIISFPERMDLWDQCWRIYVEQEKYQEKEGKSVALSFYEDKKQEMQQGAELLWPERYDLFKLMTEYYISPATFNAELQNVPRELVSFGLDPETFHYWDKSYKSREELLSALGQGVVFYGACDPSTGTKNIKGDNSAIIIIAVKERVAYVLEADIRKRNMDELIQNIFAFCKKYRDNLRAFGVEVTGGQEYFYQTLENKKREAGLSINFKKINSTGDKTGRIESLSSEIRVGNIKFNQAHMPLLEEFREFPYGKHDDGIDALQMAYRVYLDNKGDDPAAMIDILKKMRTPRARVPEEIVDDMLKRIMEGDYSD